MQSYLHTMQDRQSKNQINSLYHSTQSRREGNARWRWRCSRKPIAAVMPRLSGKILGDTMPHQRESWTLKHGIEMQDWCCTRTRTICALAVRTNQQLIGTNKKIDTNSTRIKHSTVSSLWYDHQGQRISVVPRRDARRAPPLQPQPSNSTAQVLEEGKKQEELLR